MKSTNIPDYYSILQVLPTASQNQISKSYKKLASRYHPDRHSNNELHELAEEKLRQLNQAYDILSDLKKRVAYDREREGYTETASSHDGMNRAPKPTIKQFSLGRTLKTVAILAAAFFALRFIRSPRALVVVGIAVAIAWFGPRLFKMFKKKK